MLWRIYNNGNVDTVASDDLTIDNSKYSTSKNPSTGLYYILYIKNVGTADLKKYRCQGKDNATPKQFYFLLKLLGRCN